MTRAVDKFTMPKRYDLISSVIRNNILTSPAADANGALGYSMQVVNNQLVSKTFESTAGNLDVYQFMLSFRYSFN